MPSVPTQAAQRERIEQGKLTVSPEYVVIFDLFADERLAFRFNFLLRLRVDHILVVVLKFLARPLRRISQQITVFVHRAPLNRHIGPQRG